MLSYNAFVMSSLASFTKKGKYSSPSNKKCPQLTRSSHCKYPITRLLQPNATSDFFFGGGAGGRISALLDHVLDVVSKSTDSGSYRERVQTNSVFS